MPIVATRPFDPTGTWLVFPVLPQCSMTQLAALLGRQEVLEDDLATGVFDHAGGIVPPLF